MKVKFRKQNNGRWAVMCRARHCNDLGKWKNKENTVIAG